MKISFFIKALFLGIFILLNIYLLYQEFKLIEHQNIDLRSKIANSNSSQQFYSESDSSPNKKLSQYFFIYGPALISYFSVYNLIKEMRQDLLTIIEAVIANGRNTTGALNSYQYAIQATRCVLLLRTRFIHTDYFHLQWGSDRSTTRPFISYSQVGPCLASYFSRSLCLNTRPAPPLSCQCQDGEWPSALFV